MKYSFYSALSSGGRCFVLCTLMKLINNNIQRLLKVVLFYPFFGRARPVLCVACGFACAWAAPPVDTSGGLDDTKRTRSAAGCQRMRIHAAACVCGCVYVILSMKTQRAAVITPHPCGDPAVVAQSHMSCMCMLRMRSRRVQAYHKYRALAEARHKRTGR